MKDLKYCCENFKFRATLPNDKGPNIRIIKLTDPRYGSLTRKLIFAMTEGYSGKYSVHVLIVIIKYCPFCGKKLSRFYKDDAYANEIEGVTFDY